MSNSSNSSSSARNIVIALSVALPLAVAALFGIKIDGYDLSILPPIYATTNAVCAVCLVLALVAIKLGKRELHEMLINFSMLLGILFLIMYVAYHMTSTSTSFGGEGAIRYVYYFILISHIVLSIVVIPLVLFSWLRANLGNFESHKKLTRYAWPVWFYVSVTGVIVYIMISPYYT